MKPKFRVARHLPLTITVAALLGAPSAFATIYYWDDNAAGAGFGTAGANTGTWAAPTAGPTAGWSLSSTGANAFAGFTTATTDTLNFGSTTDNLAAGTISVGTVSAGDMTFGSASGAIVLSGGTITLAAAETTTVNNTTDTIQSILAGAGTSFTKAGTGTLILSGANTYTGLTTVSAGTLAYGANDTILSGAVTVNGAGAVLAMGAFNDTVGAVTLTAGTITGTGTLTSTSGFTMNNAGATSVSANLAGAVALTKSGAGTLSLTGSNNAWTGSTTVNAGTLNLNGGFGGTIGSSSSVFGVGLNNGVNGATTAVGTVATGAVANIGGGTYTLSQLSVGYTNFNMAGSGWLTMTGGTITATNSTGYFVIGGESNQPGNGQLGIGQVDLSGSSAINFNYTAASGGDVELGVRGGRGVLNISGNAALNANKIVLAATWPAGDDANTRAYVNQSGGTVTLSDAAGLSYNGAVAGRVVVYNLNGGTLNTKVISAPTGQTGASAVFNFNGGTLQAGAASANFMSNLSGAIVYAGGAKIDDGGNAITIGQALKAPTGYGLGAVGTTLTPTAAGTGYVNPPNVTFNTPSGGLPATGYAELNADGTIKDIVITSPGSGYTSGQAVTVTLQGGGGGSGATFTSVTASTASSLTGGFTKTGIGTLTLSGANTYTGGTTVYAGNLTIGTGGTLGATTGTLAVNNPNTGAGTNVVLNLATAVDTTVGSLSGAISAPTSGTNNATINTQSGRNFTVNQSAPGTYAGVIAGAGTFTLGSLSNSTLTLSGTNTYAGKTIVQNGTLSFSVGNASGTANQQLGANATLDLGVASTSSGTLLYTGAAGTLAKNINALGNGTDTIQNSGSGLLTLAGTLTTNGTTLTLKGGSNGINVTGAIAGSNANSNLIVDGGNTTLSNANTYVGNTTVKAGTLNLNGVGGTIGSSTSIFGVGLANGVNGAPVGTVATGAVANIGGGTYTVSALQVGYTGGGSGGNNNNLAGSGWLTMTSGNITATNSSGYFAIGGEENMYSGPGYLGIGQVDLSGNSVINFNYNSASAGDVEVGVRGGRGVLNISGNAALNANKINLAAFTNSADDSANTRAYVNQGGGTVTLSSATGLYYGTVVSGRVAIYNLNGGTLNTKVISAAAGQTGASAVFNFNGGTLQAGAANTTFMTGLSAAIVYAGGAKIDDGGNAITIGQALTAPTGYGLGAVGTTLTPTAAGTGYVNPPNVTFNSPSVGLPATGYAELNADGTIKDIVITSPGSGYTSAQAMTVTLQGGGGGSGATFTSVTASTASSLTGGFTKTGIGTLTLSGANTYAGGTTVYAGNLTIGTGGTLGATTGTLVVNNPNTGAGTNVVLNLATAVDTTVGSLSGTISGPTSGTNTATINNGGSGRNFTVNQSAPGTYAGVIAGVGTFTLGSLSNSTLTLSGTNTYTGKTIVQNGTLSFSVGNASGTANQQLGANATLDLGVASTSSGTLLYTGTTGTLAKAINALGNGYNTIENNGGGTLTLTGVLAKNGTKLLLKNTNGGSQIIVSQAITGASANSDLIVSGGTTRLDAASSYVGPTSVIGGGTLALNINNAIPSNSALTLGDATTTGILNLGTFTNTLGSLAFGTGGGTLKLAANQTSSAQLAATGTVVLGSGNTLDLTGMSTGAGLYKLVSGSSLSGTFGTVTGLDSAYTLKYGTVTANELDAQHKATVSLTLGTNAASVHVGSQTVNYSIGNTAFANSASLSYTLGGGVSGTGSVAAQGSTATTGSYSAVAGANSFSITAIDANATNSSLQTVTLSQTGYNLAAADGTQTVDVGNFRVGTAKTAAVTLANSAAANATYTETLGTNGFTSTSSNFSAVGSANGIIGGGTGSGSLVVGVGTGLGSGVQRGSTTLTLQSSAVNGSGLGTTSIASQTVTITATGYNAAASNTIADVTGLKTRVGGTFGTSALSISNTASATYSEGLNASASSTTGAATASGSVSNLAGMSSSTSLSVGLGGTSTSGVKSGNVVIGLESNGSNSGLSNLGLSSQTIGVSGTVYDFADAAFSKVAGTGGLSGSGTSYTLDFGTGLNLNTNYTFTFQLANTLLSSYQDKLGGTYALTGHTSQFTTTASSFTGLAANSTNTFDVTFNTGTTGIFSGNLALAGLSQQSGLADASLSTINITIAGAAIPEPDIAALLGGFGVLTLLRRRR